MAVGNQVTWQQLNSQAGQVIINAREALQDIIFFYLSLVAIGLPELEAMATAANDATANADAQALLNTFTDLNEVAQMCNGGPVPPNAPKNFLAETAPFWGGQ